MSEAKFITLEGSEGAGKSSAMRAIENQLKTWGVPYVLTREPGGEVNAEKMREILLHADHLDAKTELMLMFASRNEHLVKVILPALSAGHWVVSDRFVDASYAYQGGGRGIDLEILQYFDSWVVGDHQPDLTLYLDVDPEVGLGRAANRSSKDRIEKEDVSFFNLIRTAYVSRASADPHRIKTIDANQPMVAVSEQIRQHMEQFKKNYG